MRALAVAPGIGRRRIELHAHEVVAELGRQAIETLRRGFRVAAEAQAHDAQVVVSATTHDVEVGRGESEFAASAPGHREWKGRLAEDRRHHGGVDAHGEREAAGQAHADGADAGTGAATVLVGGQFAQVAHDGTRPLRGEHGELAAHAGARHRGERVGDGGVAPGRAEEVGQHRRHASLGHAPRELCDEWGDAGHFVDDDDRRPRSQSIDVVATLQ